MELSVSVKKVVKFVIVLIVIILIVLFYLYHDKPQWFSHLKSQPEVTPIVLNTTGQPMQGKPNSPIKIVAFEDLKCANCKRFDQSLLPWIRDNYIVTHKANYTMIVVAFLPDSTQAAVGAYCAGQQSSPAFYQYVDTLYNNQGGETSNWANMAKLLQLAQQVDNLDQDAFMTCLTDSNNVSHIVDNTNYASDVMNGELATPTLYVNGVLVRPLSKDQFKKIVAQTSK
jgi:protein-disulfide isomerase